MHLWLEQPFLSSTRENDGIGWSLGWAACRRGGNGAATERVPIRRFRCERTVKSAWKGGRFEPISQQVQLDPGEPQGGIPHETQAGRAVLDNLGARIAKLGSGGKQEGEGGTIGGHLREQKSKPGGLAKVNPVMKSRLGEFPIVIDQVGWRQLGEQFGRSGLAGTGRRYAHRAGVPRAARS